MIAPTYAGFEAARLHWNGLDVLKQTKHDTPYRAARHVAAALLQGAQGIRDTLPERLHIGQRYAAIREAAGERTRIVWSGVHFDQPHAPLTHARTLAGLLGVHDRLIAFNEPSVGYDVAGYDREAALAMAAGMMAAFREHNDLTRFWTCDPVHDLHSGVWAATDALVKLFGTRVEVVGINYHAVNAGETPLRYILQAAADRYPRQRIAITETSWHDGLPCPRFDHIKDRAGWWRHVAHEVDASGVDLACVCWSPWLNMAWRPKETWPNGWPFGGVNP